MQEPGSLAGAIWVQPGNHSEDCEPSEASRLDGDIDHAQQHVKRTQGHFFKRGPSAGVGAVRADEVGE